MSTVQREELRSYFFGTHRSLEILAIVGAMSLAIFLSARLSAAPVETRLWLIAAAAVSGHVAADFMSGLAHWLFDNWGSAGTPVIGKNFIEPFREHHVDQQAIVRHDFVETNGNNCLAALIPLTGGHLIPAETSVGFFGSAFLLFTSLAVIATNQFHKWAHIEKPGWFVELLQRRHLILSSQHHQLHHTAPHSSNYCITAGWLNPLLGATDFFGRLERAITAVSGLRPDRDSAERRDPANS